MRPLLQPPPQSLPPLLNQKPRERLSLFGVTLDILEPSQLFRLFSEWLTDERAHFVITANALFLLDADRSPELKTLCRDASLIIPDSSGITWAAKRRGVAITERLAGIDAAFQLCGLAEQKGAPVYLLGGSASVAERAARFLYRQFPSLQISGMRDGFFKESDEEAILTDIAQSRAKVVLVAMGMPKQEHWIRKNLPRLSPAIYMGVGGSFDVWAGDLNRAPRWMQAGGMEWLYRLIQEPWRAARILQLPRFAFKVMLHHAD